MDTKGHVKGKESVQLAGEEVLELTLFAEKKAWIDSRITFLSTLPPVIVTSPSPPEKAAVGRKELRKWWGEHDRIEREVGEYDMGDLERMRGIARDKSKQALSPTDTDVIEITLTTLFSIDKLLHLLRNRRKALVLLGYRLKWEDSLSAVWTAHHALIHDLLPAFLAKARWSIPLAAASSSRNFVDDSAPPSSSLAAPTSTLTPSSSSRRLSALAASTSHADLAALTAPSTTATSASSISSSTMSRTMRLQMLKLSTTNLLSHLQTLTTSLLPASASHLDKLIDSSPTPLPDAFLDEQDKVEEEVGKATKGLEHFVEEMGGQHKTAEGIFEGAKEAEREALVLLREVEESFGRLPSLAPSPSSGEVTFFTRVNELEYVLSSTRDSLASIPCPTHPAIPDQSTSTALLLQTLSESLLLAEEALVKARKRVERYEKGRAACEVTIEVRGALEELRKGFREVELGMGEMQREGGRPVGPEQGVDCLDRGEREEEWEKRWDGLRDRIGRDGEEEQVNRLLVRRATDALAMLSTLGVAAKLRREVREVLQEIRGLREDVRRRAEGEEGRRERLRAAREVGRAVGEARGRVEEVRGHLERAVRVEGWDGRQLEGEGATDGEERLDGTAWVEETKRAVGGAVTQPFANAARLLFSPSHSTLFSHLAALVDSVRSDAEDLGTLAVRLERVRDQQKAVRQWDSDVVAQEMALAGFVSEAQEALRRKKGEWEAGTLSAQRETATTRLNEVEVEVTSLVETVGRRVPFLSTSTISPDPPPSPRTPTDAPPYPSPPSSPARRSRALPTATSMEPDYLFSVDASIRTFVNSRSARLYGLFDDARRNLALVAHLERTHAWDEDADKVEDQLARLEAEVTKTREASERRRDDSEESLSLLSSTLAALDFTNPSSALSSLSTSLDTLLSSSASSSPPFTAHLPQREKLEALSTRLSAAVAAAEEAKAAVASVRQTREERVREWKGKRDELLLRLRESQAELDGLAKEATGLEKRLADECERLEEDREELICSPHLRHASDVDQPAFSSATTALPTLTAQVDAANQALSTLSFDFTALESSLKALQCDAPSLSLDALPAAQTAAQSAASFAFTALSSLSSKFAIVEAASIAWQNKLDAELDRRSRALEREQRSKLVAWARTVRDLAEKAEATRAEVDQLAKRARRDLQKLEAEKEESRREMEELLASVSLAADSASPPRNEAARKSHDELAGQLREFRQQTREVEGRATALRTEQFAAEPEAADKLEELDGHLQSLPFAVEGASSALALLEGAIDDLEREEGEWSSRRDAELERRQMEEEEKRDELPFPSTLALHRSRADPSFDVDGQTEDGEPPSGSPTSPDPFSFAPSISEPPEVQRLRAQLVDITVQQWLDSSVVLNFPSVEEAKQVQRRVAACRETLEELEADSSDVLIWIDVDGLVEEISKKAEAGQRVMALAKFAENVDSADQCLSRLLDSIDAADPTVPARSPLPDASPPIPLSEAISSASDSVTAVRLAAIPLVDDARVEQAIQRIEETWSEMLSMVEPPRAESAASTTSTASRRSLRQRISDASSRASSRASTRTTSKQANSRPSSQASSRPSSTRPTTSAASTSSRPSRPPSSSHTASIRSIGSSFLGPQTPRKSIKEEEEFATPTLRHRVKSGLPLPSLSSSIRRAVSPAPKSTPTVIRAFSFNTPTKRDLGKSVTGSIPRRTRAEGAGRRDSTTSISSSIFSPPMMQRVSSTRTTASSTRRDSLASSVSTNGANRRSSYGSVAHSPCLSTSTPSRSTPPRRTQPYRANLKNKLDRRVGEIVNELNVHVPIAIAEGKWTDESGMYEIGGRLYFCRILRSKQVMVRVGGGWQGLLPFLVTHFGLAEGLTISPSRAIKKSLAGEEPTWISSKSIRDSLAASHSSASLRDYLSSSLSSSIGSGSSGSANVASPGLSLSMRRTFSSTSAFGTPLRRSLGGNSSVSLDAMGVLSHPPPTYTGTPKTSTRSPLPVWRI